MTTAGSDGQIRQWDLKTNREVPRPDGYAKAVGAILSPDGALVIVGDKAGAIDVYDAKTGKLRYGLPRPTDWADWCTFALSPDGRALAAARPEGTILWWDLVAAKELGTTPNAGKKPDQAFHAAERLVFTPDGRRLASGQTAGGLTLLDVATRKELWRVGLPRRWPGRTAVRVCPSRRTARASPGRLRTHDRGTGQFNFAIQVVDARTGETVRTRLLFDNQQGRGDRL